MQWDLPPDLEQLIHKRLANGIYVNIDEVLRHALEAQEQKRTRSKKSDWPSRRTSNRVTSKPSEAN
jgi:Arc/MetJ-type ribon-helix-helix transcriptional regulator